MGRVDPKRLSLHAGTLRPVQRFEEKAALAAESGSLMQGARVRVDHRVRRRTHRVP
jgi:hypothetical protein